MEKKATAAATNMQQHQIQIEKYYINMSDQSERIARMNKKIIIESNVKTLNKKIRKRTFD